jgi:YEATS domain-containing protein 1/3
LPIDIYFKNKEEPRIRFQYDLFLKLDDTSVNHIRYEKLIFQNPTEEFKKELLKAGGVSLTFIIIHTNINCIFYI